jgi:toxin ParE1/3/4
VTHFEVVLTEDAEHDLEDIHSYIANYDSLQNADRVLDRLLDLVEDLSTHPDRGSIPKELRSIGIREYRQLLFKPYRMIYRVVDERVVVYLIADGRRDMQRLLARRLLES